MKSSHTSSLVQPKQQDQSFPSRQQEVLAEEISKQEIKLKLGKAGPQPSKTARRVAEGVAKKEIAINTGKAAPMKLKEVCLLRPAWALNAQVYIVYYILQCI